MAIVEPPPSFTKLELRTAYGPVYREVSTKTPRLAREDEIPIIDLSGLHGDLPARKELAKSLKGAAENTGFFYVKNHGINEAVIAAAYRQAHVFFKQPLEKKEIVSKDKFKYFNGFSARGTGHASPSESIGMSRIIPGQFGTNKHRLQRGIYVALFS